LLAWDVDRLVALTKDFPRIEVPLTAIRELDEPFHSDIEPSTWRTMIEHVGLMDSADLSFPIILAADGRVMDGMHRGAKALLLGNPNIKAVPFTQDPEPDYIGVTPEDLSYEEDESW
jgi:hypothetical protein